MAHDVVVLAFELIRVIASDIAEMFIGIGDAALGVSGRDQIMLLREFSFSACG
jgi:uncharacterized membrane protein